MTDSEMQPSGLKSIILIILAFACTITTFINMGCITAATPDLSGTFVVGLLDVSWSGAACPLGMVSALSIASYLWSRIGLKQSLQLAFLVLLGGSILALIADHFILMILARFLQGLGGGMALIYGTGVLNSALPKESLKLPTKLKVCAIGLASCTSPIVGSILVQFWHWKAIFIIVGITATILFILTSLFVPHTKIPKTGKFDWFSFIMILAGCLCILMLLIDGETDGWTSPSMLAWTYGGISAFILVMISCMSHKTPLLDFNILLNFRFLFGLLASLCNIFCVAWIRAGTVQYMRNVMGYDPLHIANVFLILVLAFCLGAAIVMPLILKDKIALRVGMMTGLLGFTGAAFFLSRLSTSSSWFDVAWPLTLFGIGYAFCINISTSLALRGVPPERMSAAMRTLNSIRYIFVCMYASSVSSILSHMKTSYHFIVAERTREGAPNTVSSLDLWQNHFLDAGKTLAEAQSASHTLLNKAVELQSQVFSADYFYLCIFLVGASGVICAFFCLRTNTKSSLLS